jgi:hypothetical protein
MNGRRMIRNSLSGSTSYWPGLTSITPNHNVFLIARSLRRMVAHGSFTTHGLKMFTKRECDAVEELRQLIFNACDEHLGKWLDAQLLNEASAPIVMNHHREKGA